MVEVAVLEDVAAVDSDGVNFCAEEEEVVVEPTNIMETPALVVDYNIQNFHVILLSQNV